MRRYVIYAIELAVVVYVVFAFALFPKWTVDDAYIGFRYARNLAEHGQLTWNPGQNPIEGYTGVALVLLVAAGTKLGLSPIVSSQVVGLLSFVVGGLVLYRFLRRLEIVRCVRSAVLALYFTAPLFLPNALSGLETVLFSTVTLTSVLMLYVCVAAPVARPASEIALCALLLLAGLVRPEGALLGGASLIALVVVRRPDLPADRHRFLLLALFVYVLPGLAYFLWRWSYYGLLLPNTFYAKTHGSHLFGFESKWGTIWDIEVFIAGYVLLPFAGAVLWLVAEADAVRDSLRHDARSKPLVVTAVVTAVFGSICVFQYVRSDLMMNFSHRFLLPFFPILLVAVGVVADVGVRAVDRSRAERPLRFRLLVALTILLVVMQLLSYRRELRAELAYVSWYKRLMEDEHVQAGKFLRGRVPQGEWLAVLYDAGAIPYYSELPTVDFGGLNDPTVVKLARSGSSRDIVEYFYSFRPGVAVFTSGKPDRVVHLPLSTEILTDPRFSDYVRVRVFSTPVREYHQVVFFRKDLVPSASVSD